MSPAVVLYTKLQVFDSQPMQSMCSKAWFCSWRVLCRQMRKVSAAQLTGTPCLGRPEPPGARRWGPPAPTRRPPGPARCGMAPLPAARRRQSPCLQRADRTSFDLWPSEPQMLGGYACCPPTDWQHVVDRPCVPQPQMPACSRPTSGSEQRCSQPDSPRKVQWTSDTRIARGAHQQGAQEQGALCHSPASMLSREGAAPDAAPAMAKAGRASRSLRASCATCSSFSCEQL